LSLQREFDLNPTPKIRVLNPDLPSAEDLLPWLQRIDAARWYTNFGPLVRELEETLANQWPVMPTKAADAFPPLQIVTLSSGTAPLELGLAAMGLPQGGHVLLPAFTFPATAAAVLRSGLRPVFADVAPDTWQLTPATARLAAAQGPLALVLPVATFGNPLDEELWDEFVEETGIPVLMDAAAAFGNQPIGRHVSAAFSLHATKPFGIGEGGVFVTRDAALASRVRQLSNFGFEQGQAVCVGTNAKLSEYGAAVGLAQWMRWPALQIRRREQWARYRERLLELPGVNLQSGFEGQALPANVVLRLHRPLTTANALGQLGIETRRWYCPPLHQQPAFADCRVMVLADKVNLPVTAQLATGSLGLPWHDFLENEEMTLIVDALRTVLKNE
jgi:dTDP-4-amino-4,6-dideoxygalactose transaminase